ncbi:MAG: zf-HC2 domain-containing protein [Clostridium sp.]|nr:zf-HC2 domain-containing protein [Clostridium sp.]
MKCREVKSLMSDWLDGMLSDRQHEFQAHLDGCLPCSRRVMETKQVITALCKLKRPVAPPPPDFSAQVMARLRLEQFETERRLFRMPLRSLALAASILFLFGINGLIISSYGSGGLIGGALAPFTDNAPAALHPVMETKGENLPPQRLPAEEEIPQKPAQTIDDLPAEMPGEVIPAQPGSLPSAPLLEQSAAIVVSERQKQESTPLRRERSEKLSAQQRVQQGSLSNAVKKPAPLTPTPVTPSLQPQQVNFQELVLPEPQIFVNRRRVTENTVVKINVQQLATASQILASDARLQGATPIMEQTILTHDGRLIRIHQFEVPFVQANRFVAGTTSLGRLIAEEQHLVDITNDYAEKLTYYERLARQRLVASGEEAERLNKAINELLKQMVGLDRNTSTTQNVTVWLES